MGPSNFNFKLLSLNVRGIRTFEKRKAIFNWLSKSGADICFLQETYSTRDVENIWKKQWRGNLFFSHGTCHSKGTKYKVLNRIVFTNEKLFRFGITQSPLCTFCQKEDESIEHLLFSCKESCEFWKHVLSWLRDKDIYVGELKEVDLIFGKFDIQDDFTLINHILLLGKYYIYSRKCQNAKPSLKGFIAKTKRVYSIELHIARKRDELTYHLKKWKKLISVIGS